jgi:PAS domain S-box-containing protein
VSRILFVDDEPAQLRLAERFLGASEGVILDTAGSAREAISQFDFSVYDAIISDYQMPDMDGLEFLREVRCRYGDVPFILFTGRGQEVVAIDAIDAGVDFYLQKGVDARARFADLADRVEQAVARRRTRQHLRASEDQLHLVLEATDQGYWDWDLASGRNTVSSRWFTMLGYDPMAFDPGLASFSGLIHPDERLSVLETIQKHLDGCDDGYEIEMRLRTDDGGYRWILSRGRVIERSPDGQALRMVGTHTDVTRRMEAERARARSEHEKNSILAGLKDVIVEYVDPEYRVIWANETAKTVFGVSGAVEGEHCYRIFRHRDTPCPGCLVKRVFETGVYQEDEVVLEPEGRTLLVRNNPVYEDGTIVGVVINAFDITQRKRQQHELEKFRIFAENAHDIILFSRMTDARILEANGTASRAYGYSRDELRTMTLFDLRDPSEHGTVRAQMDRAGASGIRFETIHLRKDGSAIPVEVNAFVERFDDEPILLSIIRDISERRMAEEALLKRMVALTRPLEGTEIAFEDLFDLDEIQRLQDEFGSATGVAVLLTRPDGTPITRPSNFCRLCGDIVRRTPAGRERCRRSDSVLGDLHADGPFIHVCLSAGLWGAGTNIVVGDQHIANWLIGQVRDDTQTEEQMRVFARELGVDEEEFVEAFLEVPICSSERFRSIAQSLATIATQLSRIAYQNVQQARFIAERRRAEEALRASEERLSLAMEGSRIGIYDWRIAERTIELSHRGNTLAGFPESETICVSLDRWSEQVHPDDLDHVMAAFREHRNGERDHLATDYRFRHSDGRWIWLSTIGQITEWDEMHRPVRITGTYSDITDRKVAENALRRANRQLSLLTSITRHDILNQVTALRGFFSLANAAADDETRARSLDRMRSIMETIESQIEFTREFDDLGAQPPRWQSLGAIVAHASPTEECQVRVDLPPVEVFADPMLERVFANLLDNSLRHGGTVSRIWISARPSGDDLAIVWEDDGVGVPPDEKDRIFDRGYGTHTGLGLFLVREILGLTGMTIRENGDEGVGARFEITVPNGGFRYRSDSAAKTGSP